MNNAEMGHCLVHAVRPIQPIVLRLHGQVDLGPTYTLGSFRNTGISVTVTKTMHAIDRPSFAYVMNN